jgi:hypothetical protein
MKVRSFITQHFHAAQQHGWLSFFQEAAVAHHFHPAYLMAIGSRETNMQNIKGDYQGGRYHGFGVMQVDIGTDPEFCASGKWKDPHLAIQRGTEILADKARELSRHAFPNDHDRLWTLAASYNHGAHGSLGDYIIHGNPDLHTTGHDYGRDVMLRFAEFDFLLGQHKELAAPVVPSAFDHTQAIVSADESEPADDVAAQPQAEPQPQAIVPVPPAPPAPLPIEQPNAAAMPPATDEKVSVQQVAQSIGSKVIAGGIPIGGFFLAIKDGLQNPYVLAALLICIVVGAWLWNESKKRQSATQNKLVDTASDRNKQTVVITPPETKAG